MSSKIRCQSCGMPLTKPGDADGNYGTNADGSPNYDYCKFDFQQGRFTEPELMLEDIVQRSINFMQAELGYSFEDAHQMSNDIIPKLKRWHSDRHSQTK